jgi:hypothetical protein
LRPRGSTKGTSASPLPAGLALANLQRTRIQGPPVECPAHLEPGAVCHLGRTVAVGRHRLRSYLARSCRWRGGTARRAGSGTWVEPSPDYHFFRGRRTISSGDFDLVRLPSAVALVVSVQGPLVSPVGEPNSAVTGRMIIPGQTTPARMAEPKRLRQIAVPATWELDLRMNELRGIGGLGSLFCMPWDGNPGAMRVAYCCPPLAGVPCHRSFRFH